MFTGRSSHLLEHEDIHRKLVQNIDAVVECLCNGEAEISGDSSHIDIFSNHDEKNDFGSISVARFGEQAGFWKKFNSNTASEERGNIFDLIAKRLGLDFRKAVAWAEEFLAKDSSKNFEGSTQFVPRLVLDSNATGELEDAGLENLARSKRKLLKNPAAINWLCKVLGLSTAIIERFHLGIAEPFNLKDGRVCSNALSVPIIGRDGRPKKRRIHYNIPRVTLNPKSDAGWGWGVPLIYYSDNAVEKERLFVCGDVKDLWRLVQIALDSDAFDDVLFITGTHGGIIPEEFNDTEFWWQFEKVYFGHSPNETGNRIAENLRKICFADVRRVFFSEDSADWTDFFSSSDTAEQLVKMLDEAKPMSCGKLSSASSPAEQALGEFAIDPVNCNGAYVGGYMYYPYRVEKREIERITHRDGSVTESVVASYHTKVVRSDGAVLDIGYLPAPRGTPTSERVLALSDGTRIDQAPRPNLYATWHLDSITDFIRRVAKGGKAPHRPLREILDDLEFHFRRSVWLPFEEDYAILALYTALSFVYNVFEAVPLLMVCGPKGTGKTDLGSAIEAVAFNAKTLGQGTAASAVRMLHESRGLIIWDDLEGIAARRETDAFSDVHQMLKLSYKKKTSKKAITARNGQTTMFDFYGPKVINNTQGVDSILGSRMVTVQTKKLPAEMRGKWDLAGSEPELTFALRNELHIWGMCAADEIDELYCRLLPENRGDRKDEILVPLRAIAELSGDERLIERLEQAQQREDPSQTAPVEPVDLLEEALKTCIAEGYTDEVALPHVQLQIAVAVALNRGRATTTQISFWLQAQWVGNSMDSYCFKEKAVRVRRARLHGKETRIYKLREQFVEKILDGLSSPNEISAARKSKHPFDFCVKITCPDCPFISICEETVPGLKAAKNKRSGYRNGQL